jgi:hypothetical protein
MTFTGYPAFDAIIACREAGTHKAETTKFGACSACGEYGDGPTNSWKCQECPRTVYRFRGESDCDCECGARYNAGGQRLRDDWDSNPAWYRDDLDDATGYELQMLGYEGGY